MGRFVTNSGEVEDAIKQGNWVVAFSQRQLTETDALAALVATGAAIYTDQPEIIFGFLDEILNESIDGLEASVEETMTAEVRSQVENFAIPVIKNFLLGKSPGEGTETFGNFGVKAGLAQFIGHNEEWNFLANPGDILEGGDAGEWQQVGPGLVSYCPYVGIRFLIDGVTPGQGQTPNFGRNWTHIGNPAGELFAGGTTLLATDINSNEMFRYNGTPMSWSKIGGPGKTFAVAADSRPYALAPDGGAVVEFSGTSEGWFQIGGPALMVYAGGTTVLATSPEDGNVFRYNGIPMSWSKIGGPGRFFAITGDNRIYAISPNGGAVFEYSGQGENWTRIGGPAANLYVGGSALYATDPQTGNIFEYSGTPMSWRLVGGPGQAFCVTGDDRLHAITPNVGDVVEYSGRGTEWTRIGGPAAMLYGGGSFLVAVDKQTDNLMLFGRPIAGTLL